MVESKLFDIGEKYYHVRFRPPDQFVLFRRPEWAAKIADSLVEGAQVTTGLTDAGTWLVQNVMIPIDVTEDPNEVFALADEIQDKIEREGAYELKVEHKDTDLSGLIIGHLIAGGLKGLEDVDFDPAIFGA